MPDEDNHSPMRLEEALLFGANKPISLYRGTGVGNAPRRPSSSSRKAICCALGIHRKTAAGYISNMGWDFGRCDGCATELVRISRGKWQTVPKGFRIVYMSRPDRDRVSGTADRKAA